MKLLGLTGNIACGKSSVAALLQKRGAAVLDADALVHELYSDASFSAQVAALFGPGVLCNKQTVDRRKLGEIVFGDSADLERLEKLVHPAVAKLRGEKLRAIELQNPNQIVILEAVKLLESRQAKGCVAVWCVTCAPEIQLQRLMEKRGLDESAARVRLASQPLPAAKQKLADELEIPLFFIENNAAPRALEKKIEAVWREFLKL